MAMGPRLTPFPWETYFFDTRVLTPQQMQDALNTSLNDGVQFNVNLGGHPDSWTNVYTSYSPGLLFPPENDTFYATRIPGIPYAALSAAGAWVTYDVELDPWGGALMWIGDSSINLANHPENLDPVLKQRYTSSEMRYGVLDGNKGPTPTAGLHTYPGVWGVTGRDWMSPVWCNAPLGIEYWFSENPQRSDPSIGYSGYTVFGDQGNPYFYTNAINEVPDTYVKKIVVGMIRTSASMSNPSVSDMMMGVMVTYDGTDTVMRACANGAVLWEMTYNRTFHPDDFNFWFETAWGGDANPTPTYEQWTGWMDDFDVYVDTSPTTYDYKYMTSYDNVSGPTVLPVRSYDTYDIKFVMYMDAYSPSYPANQPVPLPSNPTYPIQLGFDSINMYTHHYWTVPVGYHNETSGITKQPQYVSTKNMVTNDYIVSSESVSTPNVGLTVDGEIMLAGAVGVDGDAIMNTGGGNPASWDSVVRDYIAELDALDIRMTAAEGGP
jgi:hypothetical protein